MMLRLAVWFIRAREWFREFMSEASNLAEREERNKIRAAYELRTGRKA